MRVLICGGRTFEDIDFVVKNLTKLDNLLQFDTIISGGATGADRLGELYADACGIPKKVLKAEWSKLGKKAGLVRNQRMLDEEHPDLVVAFPGHTGTAHMVKIAEKAKVPTIVYKSIAFKKEHPDYGFMSNYFPSPLVDHDGLIWPTSEHYYQAGKTMNERARSRIQMLASPNEARTTGRNRSLTPLRYDWDRVKDDTMRAALRYKFSNGSWMAELLLSTGEDYLLELAPWDSYWGSGPDGRGANRLGQLIMERRDELRSDT